MHCSELIRTPLQMSEKIILHTSYINNTSYITILRTLS